MLIGVWTNKTI